MSFVVMDPDPMKRVEYALEDIRAGRMVILVDDEDRENEGDLTLASDAITPEAINFMAKHGRGLICLTMTEERVDKLQLPMMVANNQSPYHTAFTVSIEAREGVTTGISARDRAHTVKVAIDPNSGPQDLVTPGHIFPLRARDGGVLVRTGQTEGSVDLARLAGLTPSGVICEIMNDDGTMARLPDLEKFGAEHRLRIVTVADLIRWRLRNEVLVRPVLESSLAVPRVGTFQSRVYRSHDGALHLALWMGDLIDSSSVLTRIQAACPIIDVFGSGVSDSNLQIELALRKIADEGQGLLVYLHVNGSYSADAALGMIREHLRLPEEEGPAPSSDDALRDLGVGAQIMVNLGVRKLRLMTNNPRKLMGLEGFGLEVVERVPLAVPVSEGNADFLRDRRQLLGHLLPEA
ncbi:MAG: 3,4-dihydroxy 2-butanone 4-phosphate synthase/GTP cyclohydrolase II [Myxococcota bacterium]|jgi:3,4-dihydroxy 2-butanone 4-phosphate synthase/GTP cyclohydrolase II